MKRVREADDLMFKTDRDEGMKKEQIRTVETIEYDRAGDDISHQLMGSEASRGMKVRRCVFSFVKNEDATP